MKVKDIMISLDKFPVVRQNLFFKEALDVMSEKNSELPVSLIRKII